MNTLWLQLLLSSVIWAEEDYFHISPNATWDNYIFPEQITTWDEARDHCQKCFKELTTITSRNVHLIVQKNASLDYWIGLRRSYNGTIPWSRWSNEDPVTYQNWYPGHPVPNKEISRCFSTTQTPLSTLITTTPSTPVTSTQTSTVTTPVTSPETSHSNKTNETCPILIEILKCLNMVCNMTYNELKDAVNNYTHVIQHVTLNTTTYSTTPHATTFSTVFNTTTNGTTTESTTRSTTASSCILEVDSCVILLSYGMWREVKCNESKPFICYDERFFGQINISSVTLRTGNLSWSEAPGNITHYRVEITGNQTLSGSEALGNITHFTVEITENPTNQTYSKTDLHKEIKNLVPGNLYRVQVFPVKCGRDLNPQNISFYTKPSAVENLTVVSVTTDSILLNWSKPEGGSDFYSVVYRVQGESKEKRCNESEECKITDLYPGYEYNFTVKAVVNETTQGVSSSVSDYTVPSEVKNLKSADNDSTVITASWDPPTGGYSGYHYCLVSDSTERTDCRNATICNITENANDTTNRQITKECENTTNNFLIETNKTDGTMYCLCVGALTKYNTLPGDMVVISAYTRPNTVSLSLEATSKSIKASWKIEGNYEKFNVTIETTQISPNYFNFYITNNLSYTFDGLNAAVNYTVTVVTLNGGLKSKSATNSKYTVPISPSWINATSDKTNITITWGVPEDSKDALIVYSVQYGTAFWLEYFENKTTKTSISFPNLKPGTTYDFNVSVVAGNLTSHPVNTSTKTEPEKRTLILTMLCSSETPLQCERNETQTDLLDKLNIMFNNTFHDLVHWRLKWVERKVNNH